MKNKINTQLLVKTGSLEAWNNKNPLLSAREIGVVEVPLNDGTSTILMKVGDGIKNFQDLPFFSALAADVEDWAKSEEKPTYNINEIVDFETYANKITELENKITRLETLLNSVLFVSSIEGDTNE